MKNEKYFGFKTISINGTNVYTCNLNVNGLTKNFDSLLNLRINVFATTTLVGKKGKQKEKPTININFTTLSYSDYEMKKRAVQLWLEELYIDRIKRKYSYLHPEENANEYFAYEEKEPYYSPEDLDF
ncbi:MAG: hypothetical protein ACK518_00840 [bacterium]|jgi:hypothetical protein